MLILQNSSDDTAPPAAFSSSGRSAVSYDLSGQSISGMQPRWKEFLGTPRPAETAMVNRTRLDFLMRDSAVQQRRTAWRRRTAPGDSVTSSSCAFTSSTHLQSHITCSVLRWNGEHTWRQRHFFKLRFHLLNVLSDGLGDDREVLVQRAAGKERTNLKVSGCIPHCNNGMTGKCSCSALRALQTGVATNRLAGCRCMRRSGSAHGRKSASHVQATAGRHPTYNSALASVSKLYQSHPAPTCWRCCPGCAAGRRAAPTSGPPRCRPPAPCAGAPPFRCGAQRIVEKKANH